MGTGEQASSVKDQNKIRDIAHTRNPVVRYMNEPISRVTKVKTSVSKFALPPKIHLRQITRHFS